MRIAVYTGEGGRYEGGLDAWFRDGLIADGVPAECRDANDDDFTGITAIVCASLNDEELSEELLALANKAIEEGVTVFWAVSGQNESAWAQIAEELKEKRQFVVDEVDANSGNALWDLVSAYLDRVQAAAEDEQPENTPVQKSGFNVPRSRRTTSTGNERDRDKNSRDSQIPTPKTRPFEKVVAVAGHPGTGSSFIALNLASALQAVLVEGRMTGTLARWLNAHNEDRSKFTHGGRTWEHWNLDTALCADLPLNQDDMERMAHSDRYIVIDVGCDPDNLAWKHATTRVFVTTPDPQWRSTPYPTSCTHKVMNRYPDGYFQTPNQIFGCDVDLVVPEYGEEALKSLWGCNPLITMLEDDVREDWLALVKPAQEAMKGAKPEGNFFNSGR